MAIINDSSAWSELDKLNDHIVSSSEAAFDQRHVVVTACIFAFLCIVSSSWIHRRRLSEDVPTYPWHIPIMKSTFAFAFDGFNVFQRIPKLFPSHETVKIEIVGDEIYVVQGAKNVAEMFRSPLLTVTRAYSIVLKQCFGTEQEAVDAYLADISGSRKKPIRGSNPEPNERISYMTHENLVKGLLTTGLPGATKNFRLNLQQSLRELTVGDDWIEVPDLMTFFEDRVGQPLLRTLYGQRLLDENPEFHRDIWKYDDTAMDLVRRVPSVLLPGAHGMREKLLVAIRRWHARGLEMNGRNLPVAHQEEPVWGTHFMKDRYHMLLSASQQTKDSVASTDLALMWASVTNVVPSSATLLINVLERPGLLSRVHQRLEASTSIEAIEKDPLLLSIYAETLRLNVQIHVPRSAALHEVRIGGTVVPRNKLIVTNVMVAHMDEGVWNTQDGKHPVKDFWAERFIVDSADPSSGPIKGGCTGTPGRHFSTEGLEGAWIPYGGGQHACPGRLLARRIMLSSLAMLLRAFEIALVKDDQLPVRFYSPRFGFGTRKPVGAVLFKIRRRRISQRGHDTSCCSGAGDVGSFSS